MTASGNRLFYAYLLIATSSVILRHTVVQWRQTTISGESWLRRRVMSLSNLLLKTAKVV